MQISLRLALRMVASIAVISLLLPGCTQMPTERQSTSDLRPQISFRFSDQALQSARVILDNLDVGSVTDFREGQAALRVLSGTHLVRIVLEGRAIVEEKFYVGDGVNRIVLVK